MTTVACDPNDPFMIIYTSGTTGAPKGIVHCHVGYLVKSGLDFGYAFDIQTDDRLGWIADMGWMLGPLMIVGVASVRRGYRLHRGSAELPVGQPAVADRRAQPCHSSGHGADRGARAARRDRWRRRRPQDISSLRAFTSTGEAWDVPTWHWLFETVGKKRLPDPQLHRRYGNRRRHPVELHDRARSRRPPSPARFWAGCRRARCRRQPDAGHRRTRACTTPGRA